MTKILIFWGPNYLLHATTNTAAYKCFTLFSNTFLPSGKTVLVYNFLYSSSFQKHLEGLQISEHEIDREVKKYKKQAGTTTVKTELGG